MAGLSKTDATSCGSGTMKARERQNFCQPVGLRTGTSGPPRTIPIHPSSTIRLDLLGTSLSNMIFLSAIFQPGASKRQIPNCKLQRSLNGWLFGLRYWAGVLADQRLKFVNKLEPR